MNTIIEFSKQFIKEKRHRSCNKSFQRLYLLYNKINIACNNNNNNINNKNNN